MYSFHDTDTYRKLILERVVNESCSDHSSKVIPL